MNASRSKSKEVARPELLYVEILEAKPNKMFTEEQRRAVRFLRFNRTVSCTECGRRRKIMWTMLCEFYAYSFGAHRFAMVKPEKKHPPLDAVCGEHPLAPAWAEEATEHESQE